MTLCMVNLQDIQAKWQKQWDKAHLFQAEVDTSKPKYFVTFPYPYVNGLPHVGHLVTLMRVDAFARYKRMHGFNILFPQGWHATGSPVVSAAKLVASKNEKQIQILKDLDVPEEEIPKFADPKKWTSYFPPRFKTDFAHLGASIDWRREFITTESSKYKAFIRWQFLKLKEKGYVQKGKFPVVWDPVDNNPVGDHARSEGEGETPQEFTLIKHRRKDGSYIVTATLRPETILGVTNLFINPNVTYVLCTVDDEEWVVSEECAKKLEFQDKQVTIIGQIKGTELIGERVFEFSKEHVLVLPANFCDPNVGTGIVHSVPTDSPDDYIMLYVLQHDETLCTKYGLDFEEVKEIALSPVLDTPGYGDTPAEKICTEMKITSPEQLPKLKEAKQKLYKVSFYESTMNAKYTKDFFAKDYTGQPITKVKDAIRAEIVASEFGDVFYELTGKVVSRSKNECLVKIVADQWFLAYGDEAWKLEAKQCLEGVKLYPEKVRAQFLHTIDWLHNWACTREQGLGTRLPWDEKWLIESLSDSTAYMAFYTIAHMLQDVPAKDLTPEFFDWVFSGKGTKPDIAGIEKMRETFLYWYPVDFRNSGKGLVQNHLTFYLFNHTALFEKKHWPKGIGVNGYVTVDGKKMSKSLGNMIPVRRMVKEYSADACRATVLNGGEELDDLNWDSSFAKTMDHKLVGLFDLVEDYHKKGVTEERAIDQWFAAELHAIIRDTTEFMEKTLFRSAIQRGFFDLQRMYKWYMRRTKGHVYSPLLKEAIEAQILLLAPFCPHVCEELWSKLGKREFVSVSAWPSFDAKKIDPDALAGESFVRSVMDDVRSVLQLVKITPKDVTLFIAEDWMYDFVVQLKSKFDQTRNVGELIRSCQVAGHEADVAKLIQMFVKNPSRLPQRVQTHEQEVHVLRENVAYLSEEFGVSFTVVKAEDSTEKKAKQALPGKPAIFVA